MSKRNNNSRDSIQYGKGKITSDPKNMPGLILMLVGSIFTVADILYQLFNAKEECKKKNNACKTDDEIRKEKAKVEADTESYVKKHQADADLYERKCQADVEKAKQMHEIKHKNDESAGDESIEAVKTPIEYTYSEISKMPTQDFDKFQLIGKLISMEDICIVYSEPGLGKSVFAHQVGCEIAMGKKSMLVDSDGVLHSPQMVRYCDTEMSVVDNQRRYPGGFDLDNFHFCFQGDYKDENYWLLEQKKALADIQENTTVILDNINSAFNSLSPDRMRKFFTNLKAIQHEANEKGLRVTFIIVAHPTKDGVLAGVSNFERFATTILRLDSYDEQHVKLIVEKNRKYGEMRGKHFLLKKSDNGYKHFEFVKEIPQTSAGTKPTSETAGDKISSKSPKVKKYPELTWEQYNEMHRLVDEDGWTQAKAAEHFGVPPQYYNRNPSSPEPPKADDKNE